MNVRHLAGLIIGGLGLSGLSALASPPPEEIPSSPLEGAYESQGNFYVKVGGEAIWFNPSKYQLPTALDGDVPYGSQPFVFDNSTTTGQGSATFGYVISQKPVADWVGSNLRIELSGSYLGAGVSATETNSTDSGPFTSYYDVRSISNGVPLGTIANPGETISTSYHAEYELVTGDLLVKSDYELGHGDGLFTPEAGVTFAYYDQRYGSNQYNISTPANSTGLSESMENTYIGAKLGFELKGNLTKDLSIFVGSEESLLALQSSYSGNQTVSDPTTSTAFQSENRTQFAFRGQFSGGIEYNFHPVILRLTGSGDYWQNVGAISRSTPPTGSGYATPSGPTTIAHTYMCNEGATVSVIIPF